MNSKIIIIPVAVTTCVFSIFAISKDRYILSDTLAHCCDFLVCDGHNCSSPSTMHHKWYNDCDEEED